MILKPMIQTSQSSWSSLIPSFHFQSNIAKRAEDNNCATHLIRNAIGQTEHGISHGKLSAMLTLPENYVRYYRDDITVTVVYFDEVYLRANLEVIGPD